VLHRPAGLGTNEDLDLSFVESDDQTRQRFNLANHTVTDGDGCFVFDRVPAGKPNLHISHLAIKSTVSG
jgi:hypothetical protein